jgi:hypothetical protein
MLEDYLLGNKIIRSYSKNFSEKDFKRVMRCTLILGIQTLRQDLPNFNQHTPQEIENIIIENLKGENYPYELFER